MISEIRPGHAKLSKWQAFNQHLLAWGPGGLFLLALLDSAGIPIPGGVDFVLVNVSAARPAMAVLAAVCALTGSLLGSLFLFLLARKGGELMLARHTATGRGAQLRRWFETYGMVTVFIPALSPIPLPMKIPVFCSGALGVRTSHFLAVVGVARAIRYFGLALFAARYGGQTLLFVRAHLLSISLAALILAAAGIILIQIRTRRIRSLPA